MIYIVRCVCKNVSSIIVCSDVVYVYWHNTWMELSQKSKLDQEEDESGGSTDKSAEHHMGSVR